MKTHRQQIKFLLPIFLLIVFATDFGQSKPAAGGDAEASFQTVLKLLNEKPKWLFGEEVCPFDLIPRAIVKLNYFPSRCAENAENCLEKCRKGDGNSCYALALNIQQKGKLLQTSSEALFQKACALGIASGCTNRAAGILNQTGDDRKAFECAAKTFEKTCGLNDSWGCTMYAMMLHRGEGVKKDDAKALKVLSKSCLNGEKHEACAAAKNLIDIIKTEHQNSNR